MAKCKCCKADCAFRGEDREKDCLGYIAMTNADCIRAMSDEELAEWLDDGDFGCNDCPEAERLSAQPSLRGEVCDGACKRHFLEWLKQPVKDGDNDG